MKFSWDRAWGDLAALTRAHAEIVLVVAGVFVLLPALVLGLYFQPVPIKTVNAEALRAINAYFAANWLPLVLGSVAARMGEATILAVLLNTRKETVGQSVGLALKLLFPFVVLTLIVNFAVFAGLIVLLLPGIYLMGRLAVSGPAMVAEREGNPLNAIARSLALTRGNGWTIAALIILVFVVSWVATGAIKTALTVLLTLVVPAGAIAEVTALVSALLDTVATVISVLLVAVIYRQLAGAPTFKQIFS